MPKGGPAKPLCPEFFLAPAPPFKCTGLTTTRDPKPPKNGRPRIAKVRLCPLCDVASIKRHPPDLARENISRRGPPRPPPSLSRGKFLPAILHAPWIWPLRLILFCPPRMPIYRVSVCPAPAPHWEFRRFELTTRITQFPPKAHTNVLQRIQSPISVPPPLEISRKMKLSDEYHSGAGPPQKRCPRPEETSTKPRSMSSQDQPAQQPDPEMGVKRPLPTHRWQMTGLPRLSGRFDGCGIPIGRRAPAPPEKTKLTWGPARPCPINGNRCPRLRQSRPNPGRRKVFPTMPLAPPRLGRRPP